MLAKLKSTLSCSKDLNLRFDDFIIGYTGHEGALHQNLVKTFGDSLWKNYLQLAAFFQEVHAGKYGDTYISACVWDQIKDIKHQIFLTFRRLIGLSCVKDNGPCPLCLRQCDKENPRATSHVIADAAFRAIIAQFDNRMDRSIACFQQGVLVKGKNGPSSIKWKMLCRKCEQFVCDSGEASFTELLKSTLPAINELYEISDALWRFTFAATLLWRTMHVVEPFANCADVRAMYPLYDEFNELMSNARNSLACKRPIAEIYPSIAIHVSAEGDKGGTQLGMFFGASSSSLGYVHAQIWNFHFFGFFNNNSRLRLYSDAPKPELSPTWSIQRKELIRPTIVQCEEERLMSENNMCRESAGAADVEKFLDRCTVIRDATTNMTKFKEQPAIPNGKFLQSPVVNAVYYPDSKIVTYNETFSGEDKFFGAGFDLVFEKSKFEDENVVVANFLSLIIDLNGNIKRWLDIDHASAMPTAGKEDVEIDGVGGVQSKEDAKDVV